MRHPARRKALLVGAACGVALLGAGVAFREDIAFRYYVWRLDRALTFDDARPWLAKLEGHIQDPARAQRLVAMLGPGRSRLTFWALIWAPILTRDRLDTIVGLRHFARSLEDRARRDEGFLAVMAHFIRWNQGSWVEFKERWLLDSDAFLRREPTVQESFVRTLDAWLLAEAWLIGMPPPLPVEWSFPLSKADMDMLFRRWQNLRDWIRSRPLRFDPALGRFVEAPPGKGSLDVVVAGKTVPKVPYPAEPLPGWTGPVPQVP